MTKPLYYIGRLFLDTGIWLYLSDSRLLQWLGKHLASFTVPIWAFYDFLTPEPNKLDEEK